MEENDYLRDDYKNGVQESLWHGSGPEKIQAFAALPGMIKNGIYVGTSRGKARQQGMKRHVFAAKVDINGKLLLVGFVISEDAMGRRFYNHELTEIKNLGGRPSQGGAIGLDTEKAFRTHQDSDTIICNTKRTRCQYPGRK